MSQDDYTDVHCKQKLINIIFPRLDMYDCADKESMKMHIADLTIQFLLERVEAMLEMSEEKITKLTGEVDGLNAAVHLLNQQDESRKSSSRQVLSSVQSR